MNLSDINSVSSEYLPLLQWLGLLTLFLVAGTIAASLTVHRRTMRRLAEPWVFKAVLITGVCLSFLSFAASAVVGIEDENATLALKEHSFATAVTDTYGASVEPGATYSDVSYKIARSGTSSTKADFLIGSKLTSVTVKQIDGKWLLFDESGNELARVKKA